METQTLVGSDAQQGFRGGAQGLDPRVVQMNSLLSNADRLPIAELRYRIQQAMATSDFPYLTGAVLERRLLGMFDDYPETIEKIFKRVTRMNFNLNNAIALNGGSGRLPNVAEGAEYQLRTFTESNWQYKLGVYGHKVALSWQAIVNDDLGAFNSIPERFAIGARRTRQWLMTSIWLDANGWKSTLFDTTGGQTAVATGVLNAANLATGIQAMSQYTKDGEPIMGRPKYLYVPPALEQTAVELVNEPFLAALVTGLASTSSGTKERVSQSNEYIRRQRLEVVTDPWAPIVATSGTKGNTLWGLFSEPNDTPAGEIGVLMGHETPVVLVKAPDAVRVGGGSDSVGDFDTDGTQYKVRDVFGGCAMYPQARYLSNGQ
jgi:hypothetical protein